MTDYQWNPVTDEIRRRPFQFELFQTEAEREQWLKQAAWIAQEYEPDNFEKSRRVAKDAMLINGNALQVSTVFLAIDHAFGGGRPILFETIVFGADDFMVRYHTAAAAREGHRKILDLARFCFRAPMLRFNDFEKILRKVWYE